MLHYEEDKKQEVLPALLMYNEKPVSPSVISARYYASPNNGSVFSATTATGPIVRVDIPGASPGHHLNPAETILVFSVKNSTAQTLTIDGSAFAFISSVDVMYGSSLISHIDNYDCYATALSDFTSDGRHYTRGVDDLYGDIPVGAYAEAAVEGAISRAINNRDGRSIAAGASATFALPMVNLLGTLCQKGIALSQLRDAIKLELRFNNLLDFGVYSAAPVGTVDIFDCKLWLTNVQISSSVENALMKQIGGIVQVPCFDVENFRTSVGANSSSFTYQIPIRCSSLVSVFFSLREGAVFNNRSQRVLSRTAGNLKSYNFRIGSTVVPSSPISCADGVECRIELMRALNAIGAAQSDSFINNATYNAGGAAAMTAGAYGGRFYGLQLSAFAASELLSDGKNLKSETLVLDLSFNSGGNVALQLDVWCVFEKVLTIQQAQLTYKN
jgi:hypothetical protein